MFEKLHLRIFQTQGMRYVRKRLLLKNSNNFFECGNLHVNRQIWIPRCSAASERDKKNNIPRDIVTFSSPSSWESWQRWFMSSWESWQRWFIQDREQSRPHTAHDKWAHSSDRLIFFCFCPPRVNIKALKRNMNVYYKMPSLFRSFNSLFSCLVIREVFIKRNIWNFPLSILIGWTQKFGKFLWS